MIFTAFNRTQGAFAGLVSSAATAEKAMGGAQKAITRLNLMAIAGFATIGVVGVTAFVKAAEAAGKYQMAMTTLQQQTGATDTQMNALGRTIESLAGGKTATMFSATQLARAAIAFQQSGMTLAQTQAILPSAAYGAEIAGQASGHYDVEDYARKLSSTMKAFGISDPKEAARFTDTLVRVLSVTHLDPTSFLAMERQFGQVARLSGMKPEQFAELPGFLSQMGFAGSNIGMMLKNVFLNALPYQTMTSHQANVKFNALAMLGLLGHTNISTASQYAKYANNTLSAIGLPALAAGAMTPTQQKAYLDNMMRQSVTSRFIGADPRTQIGLLHDAYTKITGLFGEKKGTQMFLGLMRQAFNIRGITAAASLAERGTSAWDDYIKQLSKVMDLEQRAAIQRQRLIPGLEMMGNALHTIFMQIGGVAPGGQAIPGGALSIMTGLVRSVNLMLHSFVEFGAENPKIMAAIGTLVGALGIGSLVAALTLAGMAVTTFATTTVTAFAALPFVSALIPVLIAGLPYAAAAVLIAGVVAVLTSPALQAKLGYALGWIVAQVGHFAQSLASAIVKAILGIPSAVERVKNQLLHPKAAPPPTGAAAHATAEHLLGLRPSTVHGVLTPDAHSPFAAGLWAGSHPGIAAPHGPTGTVVGPQSTFVQMPDVKVTVNVEGSIVGILDFAKKMETAIQGSITKALRRGTVGVGALDFGYAH